jgi:DNA ligase (NAD+)
VWCVTGSFETFKPRELAMEEVKKRGGAVVSAVSSKTTHLLAGSAAGSKLEKARKLGVKVVGEKEFLAMLAI